MELNNTRKAKKDILFFNRVPKVRGVCCRMMDIIKWITLMTSFVQVGSQTTMELLKSLSIKNKFHYHKDRTQKVETIKLTMSEEVSELWSHSTNWFLFFRSGCPIC